MEVRHYKDADGNWFREIIETKFAPLQSLMTLYAARGHKAWLNIYDERRWILTVCTGKEK